MNYKSKFSTKEIDELFEAILELKSLGECYQLFEDLCTINEIQDMSLRLTVAKMLNKKISYQKISEETMASSATISRVAKSLFYGANGYNIIIERLEEKDKK